jgi:hypothetical protein
LWVKKAKISLQSPKAGFGARNKYGLLHEVRKNILLRVKKAKIDHQSPKTKFEAQNFTWIKKNILLGSKRRK